MTQKLQDSMEFVTRHYRTGASLPTRRFATVIGWRRPAIAASIAAGVLAASAAYFVYFKGNAPSEAPAAAPVEATAAPQVEAPTLRVERIEFADVPLGRVALEIESVYGVKLSPLSEAEASQRITLSYEGTAADLVATINSLLGTDITIITPADTTDE